MDMLKSKEKTSRRVEYVKKALYYLPEFGARPPRAKSTNDKPSKPQKRTVVDARTAASEPLLTDRLSRLSLRSDSVTSNCSNTSGPRHKTRVRSASTFCKSLEDMVHFIQDSRVKNIVVMCGAGISTASGIPDFRSPKTGLYANLKQYKIPYPESIFDLDYFQGNPKPFYALAKELYPTGKYRPNYVHYFLRLLHEKGVLLRIYTQNIDGLERLAGIPTQKLVEAHGMFYTSSCTKCRESYESEIIRKIIFSDKIPRCHKNRCLGLIKPDIVFFGEDLQRRFYYYLKDFPQADMLLVMGTSLEVEPFAGIVDSVRYTIPRILFNRNAVGPFKKKRRMNDVVIKGDIVEQLRTVAEMLGWHDELMRLITESEKNANVEVIELLSDDKSTLTSAGLIANPSSHTKVTGVDKNSDQQLSDVGKNKYATGIHRPSYKPKSISAAPNMGGTQRIRPQQNGAKTAVTKPLQTTNLGALLPRLTPNRRHAFHAQSSLYRSNSKPVNHGNNFTKTHSVAESSEEDSDSDDSEDDSDDD